MRLAAVAVACCAIAPPAAVAPVLPPAPAIAAQPPARGGHAKPLPSRGGYAKTVDPILSAPIGDLAAWLCLHGREGAWNDPGDPYWGGLQMDRSFMRAYGADVMARHAGGLANVWTPREQIVVAQRGYEARRGYNPWPKTGRACGLPMHV